MFSIFEWECFRNDVLADKSALSRALSLYIIIVITIMDLLDKWCNKYVLEIRGVMVILTFV